MADETDDDPERTSPDAAKQSGAKKGTSKKGTAKKSTSKKGTAKKGTAKKSATKKTAAEKASGKAAGKKAAKKGATATTGPGREPAGAAPTGAGGGGLPAPGDVPRPWLDAYPPNVPSTYPYPQVPLTRLLDDAAIDFPRNEAVHFSGASMTYRQLLDEVDRFANALAGLGVSKGDRVGLIMPNCPQHVVAVFATLRLGAIVVENNPMDPEPELAHRIGDAGCRVLVCLDPVYARLARIRDRIPSVEHVIVTGIQDALPFPKNRLFPLRGRRDGTYHRIAADEPALRMDDLIRRTAPAPPPVEVDAANDVAMLLYTGGTTGTGKGVMLTHANLVANAFQARLWIPDIRAGAENLLCVLPFFHSYGMTAGLGLGVLSAATLTLLARFDVDATLKTIDERRPTLLPGVPRMYAALSEAPDVDRHDLSSLRVGLSAAAPLPEEVVTAFERVTGARLREGYGLTEAGPITHANPIYGRWKAGAVGMPLADTVCTLRDVNDPTAPAPAHGPGELAVAGPQVMAGYWNRPQETAATLVDGWLLTGDIATVDDEGYFSIVDRKQELIIVSGYHVYPGEVEEALRQHPAVRRAAVAGVADDHGGEKVKAFVVLEEGADVSDDGLLGFLGHRLAPYKLPRHIEFRDELPESVVGTVLRRQLAADRDAAGA